MGALFSFDGRVGRQTFWLTSIGAGIVAFVIYLVIGGMMGGTDSSTTTADGGDAAGLLLAFIVYIVYLIISLAVQVKRWHDRGKSGWWILIGFVPLIGGLWALIECGFLAGTPGPNQYGPQP